MRALYSTPSSGFYHAATNTGDRMPNTFNAHDDRFRGEIGFQHVPENASLGAGGVHLVAEVIHRALEFARIFGSALGIIPMLYRPRKLDRASLFDLSSPSSRLSSALALLSWIRQFFVRLSFSPKLVAEFSSAARVSILAF